MEGHWLDFYNIQRVSDRATYRDFRERYHIIAIAIDLLTLPMMNVVRGLFWLLVLATSLIGCFSYADNGKFLA